MDLRVTALLSLLLLGCAGPPPALPPPGSPKDLPPVPPSLPPPPSRPPEPPPPPPVVRVTSPRPRPDPAVVQAVAELVRNPDLHLRLLGPDAEAARKTMLRLARGRVAEDRIHAEPDGAGAEGRAAFRFYVPDEPRFVPHLAAPP